MGLAGAVFKRRLNKDEEAEKKRQELERKTSKNTEEVVASIGDLRAEREQLAQFDEVEDDGTGIYHFLESVTKLTRGLADVLTPDAQRQLAWKMAMLKYAFDDKNWDAVKYYRGEIVYFYSLLAPLMPQKNKPDVYFMPYIQKPGQTNPDQKLIS